MEKWISLMDYALKNEVSLSTLRRHIKSKKIPFKLENGRYFLLDNTDQDNNNKSLDNEAAFFNATTTPSGKQLIEELTIELKKAHEEITELKMLVAIYEETLPSLQESSSRVLL